MLLKFQLGVHVFLPTLIRFLQKKKVNSIPTTTTYVQKSRSYFLRQQACSGSKGRSTVEHWTCFKSFFCHFTYLAVFLFMLFVTLIKLPCRGLHFYVPNIG